MRNLHGFLVLVFVVCFCFSLGSVTVSATSLEDPTVPDPTVVLPDSTDPTEEEELVDLEPYVSDNTVVAFSPRATSSTDGLASWNLENTQLGNITLYAPQDINSSGIKVINNQLVNFNNSTVYFYCPTYSSYTFSASRFSPVYYRATNQGATNTLLNADSIEVNHIDFTDFYSYIIVGLVIVLVVFILWRCIFK